MKPPRLRSTTCTTRSPSSRRCGTTPENNGELLTTQWLMFDGELSKLEQASKIENLMVRQGEFHDALEAAIAELEELAVKLQPPPEE